jgi:hypothetical protein
VKPNGGDRRAVLLWHCTSAVTARAWLLLRLVRPPAMPGHGTGAEGHRGHQCPAYWWVLRRAVLQAGSVAYGHGQRGGAGLRVTKDQPPKGRSPSGSLERPGAAGDDERAGLNRYIGVLRGAEPVRRG